MQNYVKNKVRPSDGQEGFASVMITSYNVTIDIPELYTDV